MNMEAKLNLEKHQKERFGHLDLNLGLRALLLVTGYDSEIRSEHRVELEGALSNLI